MQVVIVGAPGVADIVARCASDAEVPDRSGRIGRGFTNLKRILGRPSDFDVVVEGLAKTVPRGNALAGADEGSWALVGALALRLGIPAVLVRRAPKRYFISYGDDPTVGDGRLAGERLASGTPIHLVDNLVYSGETLCAAVDALRRADLVCTSASAILWTQRAEASTVGLEACGLQHLPCLIEHPSVITGQSGPGDCGDGQEGGGGEDQPGRRSATAAWSRLSAYACTASELDTWAVTCGLAG